jgi:hypothetical protein
VPTDFGVVPGSADLGVLAGRHLLDAFFEFLCDVEAFHVRFCAGQALVEVAFSAARRATQRA